MYINILTDCSVLWTSSLYKMYTHLANSILLYELSQFQCIHTFLLTLYCSKDISVLLHIYTHTFSRTSYCSMNFLSFPANSWFSSRSLRFLSWWSVICCWISVMVDYRKEELRNQGVLPSLLNSKTQSMALLIFLQSWLKTLTWGMTLTFINELLLSLKLDQQEYISYTVCTVTTGNKCI